MCVHACAPCLHACRECICPTLRKPLYRQIHTYPGPDDHDETCAAVVEAILSRQLNAFVAGTFEVLETVSALSNGAVRLCLLSATSDRENYVPHCARLGCRIMQPNWSIVDKQLCEAAHAANIKVNPFWAGGSAPFGFQPSIDHLDLSAALILSAALTY